jgi:hypothetical protein
MKFTLERVSWFSSREIYRSPGKVTGFDAEIPYQIRKFPGPRLEVSLRVCETATLPKVTVACKTGFPKFPTVCDC